MREKKVLLHGTVIGQPGNGVQVQGLCDYRILKLPQTASGTVSQHLQSPGTTSSRPLLESVWPPEPVESNV